MHINRKRESFGHSPKMYQFAPLFYFLTILLVFGEMTEVDGSDNTIKNEPCSIGAIIDNSSRIGKEERVAMEMALEDFYATGNQLKLVLHIKNSERDPMQAALAARDLIQKQQVKAILGPHTWAEASLVAEVGSENHTPIVSFAEGTPKWATELWPFLVQSSRNQLKQMEAIAAIVKSWGWHQVTVIFQDRDSSANEVLAHLSYALRRDGAEISQLVALPPFASSSLIKQLEKLQRDQYRVFVVHLSLPLAVQLFEKAKEMKMMEKGYVWITTDPITSIVHSFDASTISSMQGVIGVKSYFPEMETQFQDFYGRFRKRFSSEHPEEDNNRPGIFAAQAYDAARAVALAVTESNKGSRQLLAKLVQTDFHGLSGRIHFTGQKLSPQHTFEIINVIGKSYRELGYWSDGLGFSQTIGEGATNSSSMKDLGQVIWPGGPSYTPKGWTEPTNAKPLRIGVPTRSTFKQYVYAEKDPLGNSISFSGLSIDLFKATLNELPYYLPHNFFPFNGTYDSLVEQIQLNNFDAVVGDVSIVPRRYDQHAEFTQPYTETGLIMIVPVRSKIRTKAWLFMKPFTKSMWALIGAITVYNGFVVWLIERNHCPELKGSVLYQIGILIWLSFTTLFSLQGGKLHSNLSRMTMVVWLFVALIITQTYTANLTSMLTVQQLVPTVADVDALLQTNAMVGYCRGTFVSRYLKEVLQFHPNNIKQFNSPEEYAEALRSKVIAAVFLEVPLAKIFLGMYCKAFMKVGPTYKVGGYGFVFRRRSPLLPSVTEAMLKVKESGKLRELENRMLASQKCLDAEADGRTPSLTRLSPSSFWVLFIFTGGTSTITLVVYIFRIGKSMFEHKTIWKLMLAVMKNWGNPNKRFSRKDSDLNAGSPTNSPNVLDLRAQSQV